MLQPFTPIQTNIPTQTVVTPRPVQQQRQGGESLQADAVTANDEDQGITDQEERLRNANAAANRQQQARSNDNGRGNNLDLLA